MASLKIFIVSLILFTFVFDVVFADEAYDATQELAEEHRIIAQTYEREARDLAKVGNFQESAYRFTLAAEQYDESASYYTKLHDYLTAAELHGLASLAYEESALIHSELHNYENSLLHYFLSDKSNSHSLQNKGIAMFGDTYLLPPKFQAFLIDDPHKIICKEGLELIFKINDSPACVSASTKIKLIERGWTK